ncbi:hypothetical protein SFRURICE_001354 [Spodoptera frugiperda]|nr:hypothetical protein SFRURICE_001354 [Spodoptera frugiperda]
METVGQARHNLPHCCNSCKPRFTGDTRTHQKNHHENTRTLKFSASQGTGDCLGSRNEKNQKILLEEKKRKR